MKRHSALSPAFLAAPSVGCATTAAAPGGPTRELVMAYDDARPSGAVAFPADTYESVVRFQLPDGEHQPLRLRLQAESPGSLEINIYGSTLLETPGEAIRTSSASFRRRISPTERMAAGWWRTWST